jgi:hypothetical protein
MINKLDMRRVKEHYDDRFQCHQKLNDLLAQNNTEDYLKLALGIDNFLGNYSANEHGLGGPILDCNKPQAIISLAKSFINNNYSQENMIEAVCKANLTYLKIGIGSEMAMMLKPDAFWVVNTRTIWTHLLMKHNNIAKANTELGLYRSQDMTSEMAYKIWRGISKEMNSRNPSSIQRVCAEGNTAASEQRVEVGACTYLWFDAIANSLYEEFATR